MADFAEWVTACESGLGLREGQFLEAYQRNQETANGLAIEASTVAEAIIALMKDCPDWQGTKGGLLKALDSRLKAKGENPERKNGWPQSPRGFGAKLQEIAPNLRRNGIEISFEGRGNRGHKISLSCVTRATPPEQGKEVHKVHQVHQGNEINALAGELCVEHSGNGSLNHVQLPASPDLAGEHLEDDFSADVHPNVHPVSACKQKVDDIGELGELLSGRPDAAKRKKVTI